MNSYIKISESKIREYYERKNATLKIEDCDEIVINGKVLKKQTKIGEKYITIYCNEGGYFGKPTTRPKILCVLKESYILRESFDNGDRGGHQKNEEMSDDDLWEERVYRNLCKIVYWINCCFSSIELNPKVKWTDQCWAEACSSFKKYFGVISINPFPGLVLNSGKNNTITNPKELKNWMSCHEVRNRFSNYIEILKPDIIYSGGVDLSLYSSYPIHLFNWFKRRSLSELMATEGPLTIMDRTIEDGGFNNGLSWVRTTDNVLWINGVHPSMPSFSHEKMLNTARTLYELYQSSSCQIDRIPNHHSFEVNLQRG